MKRDPSEVMREWTVWTLNMHWAQLETMFVHVEKKFIPIISKITLINIYFYISVKCMIYHFLHRTLHKVKNTHRFSLCNKARISWSRKRSLKQQLIQPINGVVSSIMIRLYIWQGKQEKSTSGNPWSSLDC